MILPSLIHTMLLSVSSPLFKPSIGKIFTKTNMSFSSHHHKMDAFNKNYQKECSSSTSCHHPLAAVMEPTAAAVDDRDVHEGIGILEYFEGKNIFITGTTGFLGKVVVEKLLRSTSVGKIYLLLQGKDKEAAFDRFKCEIINSDLFKYLKEVVGDSYEALVKEKLIPIAGSICEPNLGMDYESIEELRNNVHVIIHSAAITNFNERYDLIVNANVIAPQRVMRFAKTCNKLQLFTHMSTAYVNEKREGMIKEEPLIAREIKANNVQLDVADEISLLLKLSSKLADENAIKFYKNLGQQRAQVYGWSTSYQLSKAMGEMSVCEIKGDVPLLIIRPASIEGCYREPVPGWIHGMKAFGPGAICYGKGFLPAIIADPQTPLDLIPVDLVANTTIAAIAKHGNTQMPQPIVYHTSSGLRNPLTFFDAFEYLYEYFEAKPLMENAKITKIKFFNDFEEFSKFTKEEIFRNYGAMAIIGVGEDNRKVRQCNANVEYAQQLCKNYKFVTFFNARFDTGNTQKLIEEMSKEEQHDFEVNVKNINWKKYLQEIYIPGLKKCLIDK